MFLAEKLNVVVAGDPAYKVILPLAVHNPERDGGNCKLEGLCSSGGFIASLLAKGVCALLRRYAMHRGLLQVSWYGDYNDCGQEERGGND